jgi:hypothetical protein
MQGLDLKRGPVAEGDAQRKVPRRAAAVGAERNRGRWRVPSQRSPWAFTSKKKKDMAAVVPFAANGERDMSTPPHAGRSGGEWDGDPAPTRPPSPATGLG